MAPVENIEQDALDSESDINNRASEIIKRVMYFLQLFMCETLVKRLISLVLLALGIPNTRITEMTGLCDRSMRSLKKSMETGDIDSIFTINGGGRKGKLEDVESAIIEEIENNNYHSRQQIADMIFGKYGIKISLPAAGRLIKKNGIKRFKCGSLPAKADPEKQRTFYETVLQPFMEKAKNDDHVLLFWMHLIL